MKRLIDIHLINWKNDPYRKPLLLRGARQVGKTFAVRQFGKTFDSIVEINFELTPQAKNIFDADLQPQRIILELGLLTDKQIVPQKTLLFLDEIQSCPQAIQALRYFYEMFPELHVIAAGSLLDFALETIGIPVGRITSLFMYPLSFMEFLLATEHYLLAQAILNSVLRISFSEPVHNKLLGILAQYFSIGGMPEAVQRWIQSKNPKDVFDVHHQLVNAYRQDFQKYAKKHQIKYLEQLFDQLSLQVGRQFQYKSIHGEYRKRELAPCLDLLCNANVVHKISHSSGNGLPLGAETNLEWFKIIFLDVALCQAILGHDLASWFLNPTTEFVNRGSVAEAFVGQELLCYSTPQRKQNLYFWKRDKPASQAEVDYLSDFQGAVVPIEVKHGAGSTLRSLHLFLNHHPHSPGGIRFSSLPGSQFEKIKSLPLYAVVALAHEEQILSLKALMNLSY